MENCWKPFLCACRLVLVAFGGSHAFKRLEDRNLLKLRGLDSLTFIPSIKGVGTKQHDKTRSLGQFTP